MKPFRAASLFLGVACFAIGTPTTLLAVNYNVTVPTSSDFSLGNYDTMTIGGSGRLTGGTADFWGLSSFLTAQTANAITGGSQLFGGQYAFLNARAANAVAGGQQTFSGNGSYLYANATDAVVGGHQYYQGAGSYVTTQKSGAISGGVTHLYGGTQLRVETANGTTAGATVIFEDGGGISLSASTVIGRISSSQYGAGAIGAIGGVQNLTVYETGLATFSGRIDPNVRFTKDGSGRLVLSGTQNTNTETIVQQGVLELAGVNGGIGTLQGTISVATNGELRLSAIDALGFTFGRKVDTININGGLVTNTSAANNGWGVTYNLNGGTMISNGGTSSTTAGSRWAFGGSNAASTSVNVTGSGTSTIAGRIDLRGDYATTMVNMTVSETSTLNITAGITSSSSGTAAPVGITKLGDGVMKLSGDNIFSGGLDIRAGLVEFSTLSNLGTAAVTLNGGGLRWASGSTLNVTSRLAPLGANGGTFDTNGNTITLNSGSISGSGRLTKAGAGTLVVSAPQGYTGGTRVTSGTLRLSTGGSLGNGAVEVSGGTFIVDQGVTLSNAVTISGGAYQRTITGNLANAVNITSDLAGGKDTTARILSGTASTPVTLASSFSTVGVVGDGQRRSDVYSLEGTGSAVFVLELSFTSTEANSYLGWLSGGTWVNAREGNLTGTNNPAFANQYTAGNFASFQGINGTNLSAYIGAWGVYQNGATTSVWAVLNHNSSFAGVPEPSAVLLLTLAGPLFLWRRRSR